MEKVVGLTLIGLGAWMIYCLVQSKENEPAPTSRGGLLLKSIAALLAWIYRNLDRTLNIHMRAVWHKDDPKWADCGIPDDIIPIAVAILCLNM